MSGGGSAEDRIAAVMVDHYPVFDERGHINGTVPGRGAWECWCDLVHSTTEDEVRTHVAGEIAAALQLTEERRTLTDGWIQPSRNVMYWAQGLTPPPAIITNESRLVSPWVSVPQEEQ